jgi:thiamine-monophosphate kinase
VNKEEYFLEKYIKPCTEVSELFPQEIGDDCAVIRSSSDLLVSTDSTIEGVHFPANLNPYYIAYRSIAIAASDILAMGSYPDGYLLSISHPQPSDEWFNDFSKGILEFNKTHDTKLVGGDLSKGELNICVTVFGRAKQNIIKRSGAKENDNIYISNKLGLGVAGHKSFLKDNISMPNQYMKPQLISKEVIFELNTLINSAIDVSDGLLLDLKRICKLSGKGAELLVSKKFIFNDYEDLIAGDDYVLLFTANDNNDEQVTALLPQSKMIGKITKEKKLQVNDLDGKEINFDTFGWDSFKT